MDEPDGLDTRLDNAVWHALGGPQARFAERHGEAARFRASVSPFAAMPDVVDEASWADLASLVGPGNRTCLFRDEIVVADGWSELAYIPAVQMVGDAVEAERLPDAVRLGSDDVDAMVDLVRRTDPGPFEPDTYRLGTYLGIKEGDRLLAMAGERLRLDGITEISAVCTDPEVQGKGYASALVGDLTARILARYELPILHVTTTNEAGIALYRKLGFVERRRVEARVLQAPG